MNTLVSFYKGTERVGAPVILEDLPRVGECVILMQSNYRPALTAKVAQVVHDVSRVPKGGQRSANIYIDEFTADLLGRSPQDWEYAKELLSQAKAMCGFVANPEKLHISDGRELHSCDEILRSITAFLEDEK